MGLFEGTQKDYYQGSNLGNYQFVSLKDIINQFMLVYVGEDKIIPKAKRLDVAFHAQRALAELSFDTFKSIKSQQIELPPTLVMPLPHDYVNYTKLSWVDSSGIKHPLYSTNSTSNPFQIRQEDNGEYIFPADFIIIENADFSSTGDGAQPIAPWFWNPHATAFVSGVYETVADHSVISGELIFQHRTISTNGQNNWGHAMAYWQEIDVTDQDYIDISAKGTAVDFAADGPGVLRFGISANPGDQNTKDIPPGIPFYTRTTNSSPLIFNFTTDDGSSSYLEWASADGTGITKELLGINVKEYDKVYILIVSYHDFAGLTSNSTPQNDTLTSTNKIDDISVTASNASTVLRSPVGNEKNSSTWNNYKSGTSSESNDDYIDDTYWPMNGSRYGLDPQHAQANGSFYIDPRLGRIHFSSNISGKTVILDYISDSLGTDGEMQVHKFAEEAMYRWMSHAIIAGKANVPEYLVMRLKKEKLAAIRTAKLRLSNLKIEELTQILRGQSKWIKH
jgi:hypothetical protein